MTSRRGKSYGSCAVIADDMVRREVPKVIPRRCSGTGEGGELKVARWDLGRLCAVAAVCVPLLGAPIRSQGEGLANQGPVIGAYASALDSLVPGASGVFVPEVTDLTEHDDRPTDGDLYQWVKLRTLRSSGSTLKGLQLTRASSGMVQALVMASGRCGPPPDTSAVRFRIRADALLKGHTYWFATASGADRRYPQEIAGAWPAESTTAVALVERAIESDAYAWHPEMWRAGYVTGWRQNGDTASCQVRVWHEGRALWERRLEGRPNFSGQGTWYLFQ